MQTGMHVAMGVIADSWLGNLERNALCIFKVLLECWQS